MGEQKRKRDGLKISVLIPERGRPDSLWRLIQSLKDQAIFDENYEIVVGLDDDEWTPQQLADAQGLYPSVRFILAPRPATLGEKLNGLAAISEGDLLLFIANDMVMETPEWPKKCRETARHLPSGMGVTYLRDPTHPDHASFYMITRQMYETIGWFAAPWFPYWFIDTWMDELGILLSAKYEIDAELSAPDGNQRSERPDLKFWCEFFDATRPMRFRDAMQLMGKIYGAQIPEDVAKDLPRRRALAEARTAHHKNPQFLAEFGTDGPVSEAHSNAKAAAQRIMTDIQAQQPRRPRVAIAVPSGRTWEAVTGNSVAAMAAYSAQSGIEIAMLNVQSSLICHSRNMTVKFALENNCDYIMWIDSDMKMPADTILRLLKHNKEIVGSTYNKRTPRPDGSYETLGRLKGAQPDPGTVLRGLHEAERLPGGVLLVKCDVYRNMPEPWYALAYTWPGENLLERFKNMMREYYGKTPPEDALAEVGDSKLGAWLGEYGYHGERGFEEADRLWGEDLWFTRKVQQLGMKVWCDLDLTYEIAHLGVIEVTCLPPKNG